MTVMTATTPSHPSSTPSPTPLLLRIDEVAHLLGLGRSTIYELIYKGELPSVKVGAARRIPRAALTRWIDDHRCLPSGAETRTVYGREEALCFSPLQRTLARACEYWYTTLRCAKALVLRTTSNGLHVHN